MRQIAEVEQAHLAALCSGGIIAAMLAAYLSETGGLDRVATLGFAVTVLDQSRAGTAAALIDEGVANMAVPPPPAAATSTAGPSPRCSPGCGPTT